MPDITIAAEKQIKLLTQGKYCNSDIIIIPEGGIKLFAAIGVKYPAGSILTCTNGVTTFTADNTSGQWVFAIPETGNWTVTATDGTNTSSQTVEITNQGQSINIELFYRKYLYKEGDQCIDITGGWSSNVTVKKFVSVNMSKVEPTFAETAMILDLTSAGTYDYVPVTTGLVDLTQVDTIYAEYDVPVEAYTARLLASTTTTFATVDGSEAATTAEFEVDVGDDYTLMMDVSSLEGEYYIIAYSFRGENIDAKGKLEIKNVWCE